MESQNSQLNMFALYLNKFILPVDADVYSKHFSQVEMTGICLYEEPRRAWSSQKVVSILLSLLGTHSMIEG